MQKILMVGEDFTLSASRAALLTQPDVNVVCSNPLEFCNNLKNDRFDLVVLCHSLDHARRQSIAAEVRRRWPQARVVLITAETFPPSSIECDVDAVVASLHPAQLVRTAAALLGTPVPLQRRWREQPLRTGT